MAHKQDFIKDNDAIYGMKVVEDTGASETLKAGQLVSARQIRDENSFLRRSDKDLVTADDCIGLCCVDYNAEVSEKTQNFSRPLNMDKAISKKEKAKRNPILNFSLRTLTPLESLEKKIEMKKGEMGKREKEKCKKFFIF